MCIACTILRGIPGTRAFIAIIGSRTLCTKDMTFALRAFAAFFARSSRFIKNSPIIVTHQSGTREDLNSDDPFSSINIMSDEMLPGIFRVVSKNDNFRGQEDYVKTRTFLGVSPPPLCHPPNAITPGKVITALSHCAGTVLSDRRCPLL